MYMYSVLTVFRHFVIVVISDLTVLGFNGS